MADIETTDIETYNKELDESKNYRSVPQGPQKQSWSGIYRDYRDTPKHTVLHDLLYGVGGFSGDGIDLDSRGGIGYSYLTPLSSELQYIDRERNSDLINHFSRLVNAQVNPVDAGQKEHSIMSNGREIEDEDFTAFLQNANRKGVEYRAIRRTALREAAGHDVTYIITDRQDGKFYVQLKPITEISPYIDEGEGGELLGVTFLDRIMDKEVVAARYEMVDGVCWRKKLVAKRKGDMYWYNHDFKIVEERNTGSDEMLIHPILVGDSDYYPQHPESWSLARVCIDHYQQNNRHQWLMTLSRNPKFQGFGDIQGIRGAIGNALISEGDSNNNYPPVAQYVEPSAANIEASRKGLSDAVQAIREVASDHGVTINETAAGQSGESKKYDYDATEKACLKMEHLAKKIDAVVIRMYKKMLNKGYEYNFIYAGSYAPESEVSVADLTDALQAAQAMGASELVAEILKELARKTVGSSISSSRRQEIVQNIIDASQQADTSDM